MQLNLTITYTAGVTTEVDLPGVPGWRYVKDWWIENNHLHVNVHGGDQGQVVSIPEPTMIDTTTPRSVRIADENDTQLVLAQSPTPAGAFYRVGYNDAVRSARLSLIDATPTTPQRLVLTAPDVRTNGDVELLEFSLGDHWLIYKPDRLDPLIDSRLQTLMTDELPTTYAGMALAELLRLEPSVRAQQTKFATAIGDLTYEQLVREVLRRFRLVSEEN